MPTDRGSPALRWKLGVFGLIAAGAAVVVVVTGITAREETKAKLQDWAETQAVPAVAVVRPQAKAVDAVLELPGRLEAYSRAAIYARVSGYLKSWKVDIGATVAAGEVLAEIDAPDLDQQLNQARADLASAKASATLSEATLNRRKALLSANFVSMQEIDERTADLANKRAAVNAQQANVDRLEALAGYKTITAPFAGVVTTRNTDIGALISGGGGAGPPMFVIADVSKLRVYVDVPQSYVPAIRIGAAAAIVAPDYPDRTFSAVVESSSQSVDVASGTTRMQLKLDNARRELMPGGYASVRLTLADEAVPLHIPASALIFDQHGLRVATVADGDRVRFKTIRIARDLGREIVVGSGLGVDDRIIVAPPDGIAEGDQVRVVGGPGGGKPAVPATAQAQDGKG